jgi:hypothetical protein
MGDSTSYSRNVSHEEAANSGAPGAPHTADGARRPSIARAPSTNTFHTTVRAELSNAQQILEDIIESRPEVAVQRRTSRLRKLTNALPRLRRTGTGETNSSIDDASASTEQVASSSVTSPDEATAHLGLEEPSDEAVEAYLRRNAHK